MEPSGDYFLLQIYLIFERVYKFRPTCNRLLRGCRRLVCVILRVTFNDATQNTQMDRDVIIKTRDAKTCLSVQVIVLRRGPR